MWASWGLYWMSCVLEKLFTLPSGSRNYSQTCTGLGIMWLSALTGYLFGLMDFHPTLALAQNGTLPKIWEDPSEITSSLLIQILPYGVLCSANSRISWTLLSVFQFSKLPSSVYCILETVSRQKAGQFSDSPYLFSFSGISQSCGVRCPISENNYFLHLSCFVCLFVVGRRAISSSLYLRRALFCDLSPSGMNVSWGPLCLLCLDFPPLLIVNP